ncbi:diphosphoinositol polyphosphate phosphohydrolase 1-like isoform X2 [Saccoglossus kowalevskii]|uniref:diphosphoinositol-polyphosphate diphosphatase n=1 Tax=Saccoglossus kowalevskii TaxID=10224 RepID=A0ABM0GWJ3_SACKO|nr:PREDICTED: diphosphoinositol polyphosphate phosphohydrolase 1-like [Saccoglossus kowalevskii]
MHTHDSDMSKHSPENMVKTKPHSVRTYDDEGFRKRAACLCFRNEEENEILLVSSKKFGDRWLVPGGGLEPLEHPSVAAMREAVEEAGVKGSLGRCLGVFENSERKHRTCVYVLVVTELLETWEDQKNFGRIRQWFPVDEAFAHLEYKPLQKLFLIEALKSR